MGKIRITQKISSIGINKHQKAILASLGLRKRLQTVEHNDTPVIRGMVNKMIHMLTIEEIQ